MDLLHNDNVIFMNFKTSCFSYLVKLLIKVEELFIFFKKREENDLGYYGILQCSYSSRSAAPVSLLCALGSCLD